MIPQTIPEYTEYLQKKGTLRSGDLNKSQPFGLIDARGPQGIFARGPAIYSGGASTGNTGSQKVTKGALQRKLSSYGPSGGNNQL